MSVVWIAASNNHGARVCVYSSVSLPPSLSLSPSLSLTLSIVATFGLSLSMDSLMIPSMVGEAHRAACAGAVPGITSADAEANETSRSFSDMDVSESFRSVGEDSSLCSLPRYWLQFWK